MEKPMSQYAADAPRVLKDFLTYISTIQGKSAKTAHEYYLDLRLFFRVLKHNKGMVPSDMPLDQIPIEDVDIDFLEQVTLSDAYDYLEYMSGERPTQQNSAFTEYGLSGTSRARKVSAIRAFFRYLTDNPHVLENNPVSNLAGLNLTPFQGDTVRVRGKGNKERTVYLNEACKLALERYLPKRLTPHERDKNALFISRNRNRINVQTVKWLVKKHLEQAGLDTQKYSAHKLRHTAATLMYQNGVDIRTLQNILGHTSVNTTMIYTHIEDSSLRDAAAKNPLATVKPQDNK